MKFLTPKLRASFGWWLVKRAALRREPDFVISPKGPEFPYLRRWYLIPRNRWLNLYLHHFLRSDDDRALHDHPWASCSIILFGSYLEITPQGKHIRNQGDITFRRASSPHRVELFGDPDGELPAWTLFITGPKVREWGFHCPQGWRHWKVFTAGPKGEHIGRGCDD